MRRIISRAVLALAAILAALVVIVVTVQIGGESTRYSYRHLKKPFGAQMNWRTMASG